jgi:crooked neck
MNCENKWQKKSSFFLVFTLILLFCFVETVGNYGGCRLVFERWLEWQPEEIACEQERDRKKIIFEKFVIFFLFCFCLGNAYIKFESRFGEVDRARQVFRKYVVVHPQVRQKKN